MNGRPAVTWLTWRRHRAALVMSAVVLVAVTFCVAVAGVQQRSSPDAGLPLRLAPLAVLPVLVAIFVGSPLVAKELEHGTHHLVWTQAVSRQRWLLVQVGWLAALFATGFLALGIAVSWATAPLEAGGAASRMEPTLFPISGIAPFAYCLAGIAIGVTVGIYFGRVLPAIFVTLIALIALSAVFGFVARQRLADVDTSVSAPTLPGVNRDQLTTNRGTGWVLSDRLVTADGRDMGGGESPDWMALALECASAGTPLGQVEGLGLPMLTPSCVEALGLVRVTTIVPNADYWKAQLTESGIVLAIGIVAGAAGLHRLRRVA